MRQKRIYSTEIIDDIKSQIFAGYNADMSPFFENNINLKAPNINFKLTKEEFEEIQKCYNDAVYFVEKYCTFLTDDGRRTVQLRDYQKRILRILTEQVYIEKRDDMGPKNRGVIMMQSRQSGKCVTYNTKVQTESGVKMIGDLFNEKKTFLNWIRKYLYKIYDKL